MKMNNSIQLTEFEIFQALSGNFLCKNIPDNWSELDEEEQDNFIQENIWQPLENWNSSEIIELIEDTSYALIKLLREKGIEISDSD